MGDSFMSIWTFLIPVFIMGIISAYLEYKYPDKKQKHNK